MPSREEIEKLMAEPIREDLRVQYRKMHDAGFFQGKSLSKHTDAIGALITRMGSKSVLDFGSGKGLLYKDGELEREWGVDVTLYDPAVSGIDTIPVGVFDGVICTDVVEHVPEEEVPHFLDVLLGHAKDWLFISICTRKSRKNLPDGRNAHLTVRDESWWRFMISDACLRRRGAIVVDLWFV